eukprot:COSAG04_NODE_14235_length_576_cov_0.844864_2_plen_76_part_01
MSMEQKTRANAAKELHDANEVGCRQGTDRYLYIYYTYNTLSQAMAEQIEELTHFFKQKTAYAILRSDWSSDVCSSD